MPNKFTSIFPVFGLLVVLMTLVSCGTPTPIQVDTAPVKLTVIQPPPPTPLSLNNVAVSVVTASTLDAFIKQASIEQGTDNPVFVVVSVKGYENLSLNIAELKRYIVQQQEIIAYYRKVTTK